MALITEPGIYPDLPVDLYHADPCAVPSLSASIAKKLVLENPRQAAHAHPRLNPEWTPSESSDEKDWGSVLHGMFTGADNRVVWINASDRRKKDVQEAIAEARAAGFIPLLIGHRKRLEACVAALRAELRGNKMASAAFTGGGAERTMIWREGDTWCRARADWMCDDPERPIYDLKFTGRSANPLDWRKQMASMGYDIQHEHYLTGAKILTGFRPAFRFVTCEWNPPFCSAVMQLDGEGEATAKRRRALAMRKWERGMATGRWPGYGDHIHYISPPVYVRSDLEAMEQAET